MTTFRPMLASEYDGKYPLKFPALVSPKIDGIRCVIRDGTPMTRSLKLLPNVFIRHELYGLPNFDGEITVGDPTKPTTWNTTSSAVMSFEGRSDFTYWVFDMAIEDDVGFAERLKRAQDRCGMYGPRVRYLHHHLVNDLHELAIAEEAYVEAGYEGLMIRSPDGPYKYGRSTAKEGYLLKMKRFDDMEAEVIEVTERLRHIGVTKTNALGLTERGHKKADMEPAGDLGSLVCYSVKTGGFEVGTGFTAEMRDAMWQDKPIGKFAKIKHQGFTPDGKPRFPVFLGFRDAKDMS